MPTLDELMIYCGLREYEERFYSFDSYPWKDEHFDWMKKWAENPNCSVLITGNIRAGKSGLAIAALKERLKRGDNVWYENGTKSILQNVDRTLELKLDLFLMDETLSRWHRGKEAGFLALLNQGVKFLLATTMWEPFSLDTFGPALRGRIEKFEHIVLERGAN